MIGIFKEQRRKICIFFPIFLGLVYMILCLARINSGITTDEAILEHLSKGSYSELFQGSLDYAQPPLGLITFKIWSTVFGHNLAVLRLLPIIFGIITILFVFKLVNYKYNTRGACLASFLLTISPFFVYCGTLIGPFALFAALFACSSFFLQLYIDDNKKKWLLVYFVLAILGIWTHYLFVAIWIAHAIYLLICRRKLALVGYIPAILSFLPWIPKAANYFAFTHSKAVGFSLHDLANFWSESTILQGSASLRNTSAILTVLSLLVFAYALFKINKRQKLFLLCFAAPLLCASLLACASISPFPPTRCLICAAVSVPILLGIAIARASSKKKLRNFTLLGITVLVSIFGLVNYYSGKACTTIACSDSDLLHADIEALSLGNEPITTFNRDIYYQLSFYQTEEHPVLNPSENPEGAFWLVTNEDNGEAYNPDYYELLEEGTLNHINSYHIYKLQRK